MTAMPHSADIPQMGGLQTSLPIAMPRLGSHTVVEALLSALSDRTQYRHRRIVTAVGSTSADEN